jgi:hypothetical protein
MHLSLSQKRPHACQLYIEDLAQPYLLKVGGQWIKSKESSFIKLKGFKADFTKQTV